MDADYWRDVGDYIAPIGRYGVSGIVRPVFLIVTTALLGGAHQIGTGAATNVQQLAALDAFIMAFIALLGFTLYKPEKRNYGRFVGTFFAIWRIWAWSVALTFSAEIAWVIAYG